MRELGDSNGVKLFAPDDASLSFFNSPYIGHKRMSSVDIYPSHNEWGGAATAPTTGRISSIKRIRMGKQREFETAECDFAIGIKSQKSSSDIVRVLHCNPSVQIGDQIEIGEEIGSLIRSRYFNFWTGPHYHVEVMDEKNFNRPSQSHVLNMSPEFDGVVEKNGKHNSLETTWVVERITPDYLLACSKNSYFGRLGSLFGHVIKAESGAFGVLDAGFPHYAHGGVFGRVSKRGSISIGENRIGTFETDSRIFSQFRNIRVFLDNAPIKGISNYLLTKEQLIGGKPPLKVIPQYYGGFSEKFHEGDCFNLSLRYQNHH